MRADPVSAKGGFAAGLLNPESPVPSAVKGRSPRRFAVYRNNVTIGLVRAMEANFPAIRKLLGETYFAGLVRQFVQAHPPQSPLLFHYGAEFPAYLEAQDDLSAYPYLADVARLEQQWRISYHEADAPTLQPAALAGLSEGQLLGLRLQPHPAMALLQSRFALHGIFHANRGAEPARIADVSAPENVLITRPHTEVHVRPLTPGEFAFVSALAEGRALGEAAERALDAENDFDLTAGINLMLESGAFQGEADQP